MSGDSSIKPVFLFQKYTNAQRLNDRCDGPHSHSANHKVDLVAISIITVATE
jgi:hypothetical protein